MVPLQLPQRMTQMLGATIVPTPSVWFGQSFALALLVQETVVAILEDGAFLLTHPWICCGVQSNARNSPCHSQGQKQHHTFPSLLPHQEHFMHTELGSSALPHLPFFFF